MDNSDPLSDPDFDQALAEEIARAENAALADAEDEVRAQDDANEADAPDGTAEVNTTGSHFRFSAKQAFLTFANASGLSKKHIVNHFSTVFGRGTLASWCVGEEKHLNEVPHFHAYFLWNKKINCRDLNKFYVIVTDHDTGQIRTYKPNIRTIKNKTTHKTLCYIRKGCNFEEKNVDEWKDDTNFRKRYTDYQYWLEVRQAMNLVPIKYPFTLPDNKTTVYNPNVAGMPHKKRHWWIWGASNLGKTTWAQQTFQGQKAWMRPAVALSDKPYDTYNGQELIIFDDVDMRDTKQELCSLSNVWKIPQQCPGAQRYNARMLPLNQVRTIIVLSNDQPCWWREDGKEQQDWFCNRFFELHLTEPWDEHKAPIRRGANKTC